MYRAMGFQLVSDIGAGDRFIRTRSGVIVPFPIVGCVDRPDYLAFEAALLNYMTYFSATVYSTPDLGAFDNVPECRHC
jgi:hypothetical protein